MKYIYILFTLLCLALLYGLTKDLSEEVLDLKARDRLRKQENVLLRADLALLKSEIPLLKADMEFNNQNAQMIIDEFRRILDGKRLIPVLDHRTLLVIDEEEINAD